MAKQCFQWDVIVVAMLLAAVFVLTNTASADHFAALEQTLDENRQKWDALGIEDYDFQMQRSCFCSPDFIQPGLVHVRGGLIDSVEHAVSGVALDATSFLTVDGLFDQAQGFFDAHGFRMTAEFDAAQGYPTELSIDLNQFIADEEMYFSADELRVVTNPDRIPGDANGDGAVDRADLVITADHYGTFTGAIFSQGNFNGDGATGLSDLSVLQANFGRTLGARSAAVPEPSSAVLMLLAIFTVGFASRHRSRKSPVDPWHLRSCGRASRAGSSRS